MARVLVVAKRAALDRLTAFEAATLDRAGVSNLARLDAARRAHEACVDQVLRLLRDQQVLLRRVDELRNTDATAVDLVVTVGGDGSLFAVQGLVRNTPLLAVNSDPERSIGHFTRVGIQGLEEALNDWLHGRAVIEELPRLEVAVDGQPPQPLVNDCLFANCNPAAMTRYRICDRDACEIQRSSGVWISTAAGATGAIASAGIQARPSGPALLYKVREAFLHRDPPTFLEGCQEPPGILSLTAAMPGIMLWIDGCHRSHPVGAGETATFRAHPFALRLLRPR